MRVIKSIPSPPDSQSGAPTNLPPAQPQPGNYQPPGDSFSRPHTAPKHLGTPPPPDDAA